MSTPTSILLQSIDGAFGFLAPALERLDSVDVELIRSQADASARAGNRAEVMAALDQIHQLVMDSTPAGEGQTMFIDEVDPFPPQSDDAEWESRLNDAPPVTQTGTGKNKAEQSKPKPGVIQIQPLDLLSACDTKPPELDFVLPGMLAGTVCGIVSPGGVGKSMLALQLSALLSGVDTLDEAFGKPKPGKTTILALEDPALIIQHRVHNIMRAARDGFSPAGWSPKNGTSAQPWSDNCKIIPLCGSGWRVDQLGGYDDLCNYAAGQRLAIVDTLRRAHVQDENDNGAMSGVLNLFERAAAATGAIFLLLHHVPKPSGGISTTARGASAITDNMRYLATLRAMRDDEAERLELNPAERWRHVIFEPAKNNYCPPSGPLWFIKSHGGVLEFQGKLDEFLSRAKDVPKKRNHGGGNAKAF